MYICQDKCYRQVPAEDHHFAQREDYVFGARFCAICCVIIRRGSEAYNQMVLDRWTNGGLWECPCCKARPRLYFDLQQKQKEYLMQKLSQSKFFEDIVEHFFRETSATPPKNKQKQLIDSIRHVLSDPQYAKPSRNSISRPSTSEEQMRTLEISMFPQ